MFLASYYCATHEHNYLGNFYRYTDKSPRGTNRLQNLGGFYLRDVPLVRLSLVRLSLRTFVP